MDILWALYDLASNSLLLVILLPLALPCAAGAIPGVMDRLRRRNLEQALPEVLESISTSIGAGLGLQQALTDIASNRNDETGKLLKKAILALFKVGESINAIVPPELTLIIYTINCGVNEPQSSTT